MYDGSHFVREQEFTKSVGREAGMASLCHITVGVIFTDMKSVPFNNHHNHFVDMALHTITNHFSFFLFFSRTWILWSGALSSCGVWCNTVHRVPQHRPQF